MAHTNQTPNYNLSQFLGTDKPAWLVDYNGDMEKIDLGLKAAKDVADAAKEEADQGATDIAAVTITANSADAKATAAVSNFAEAYDATATYAIGEYVTYENLTYKCTVTITVPEPFNGNHWTRATVDSELTATNTTVANVNVTATAAKSVTDHVKHIMFNATLAGGPTNEIAINNFLPAESTPLSDYIPIQGISLNSGSIYNFYIKKVDNTLRYGGTVPSGTYYFDSFIYGM
jgi:hypothetical protein